MEGEYCVSMKRQVTGQTSTHARQTTHRSLSICHVFASRSTTIACEGQILWHDPQEIHRLSSIVTCPRDRAVFFADSAGYFIVAGRWISVFIAVFAISKNATLPHLSAQPIQGSIDMIITGTSASSQPWSIFTSGGTLVSVGVLIRDLTRNFVPLPLT